jgi:hypothetical protein
MTEKEYKIITSEESDFEYVLENLLNDGWEILRTDIDEVQVGRDIDDHCFAKKRVIYTLQKNK